MKSTMSPTEEETYELLNTKIKIKVIEWNLYINELKKSFPVPDAELEEMRFRRQDIRNDIDNVFNLTQSSSTWTQRRQLQLLSRKLWRDIDDIYENFTEEADPNDSHSDSQGLEIDDSHAEQTPPIADTEAAKVKHPDEDKDVFLDA